MQLFYKLSSSGSSDPYHFGGTRSVLSWETIVHCPRYKLRGQIRLKDTTLSLGSDLLLNHLFALQVFASFMFLLFLFFLNELGNYNLKTKFLFSVLFESVRLCGMNASVRYNFSVLFEFLFFYVRFCTALKFDSNIFFSAV